MTSVKTPRVSRLRMFAGPNGSGKSTIKAEIERDNDIWFGIIVNPDEIEANIRLTKSLDFAEFEIEVDHAELKAFLAASELLKKQGMLRKAARLEVLDNRVSWDAVPVNSYFAAVFADFIRYKLLPTRKTFSFETVMSSPAKIEFLRTGELPDTEITCIS